MYVLHVSWPNLLSAPVLDGSIGWGDDLSSVGLWSIRTRGAEAESVTGAAH